jgi:hypothetical protein
VNLTKAESDIAGMEEEAEAALDSEPALPVETFDEGPTMKSVYQPLARWQRPPPKGGYPFKKK